MQIRAGLRDQLNSKQRQGQQNRNAFFCSRNCRQAKLWSVKSLPGQNPHWFGLFPLTSSPWDIFNRIDANNLAVILFSDLSQESIHVWLYSCIALPTDATRSLLWWCRLLELSAPFLNEADAHPDVLGTVSKLYCLSWYSIVQTPSSSNKRLDRRFLISFLSVSRILLIRQSSGRIVSNRANLLDNLRWSASIISSYSNLDLTQFVAWMGAVLAWKGAFSNELRCEQSHGSYRTVGNQAWSKTKGLWLKCERFG